ncbi:MAG: alpha-glucosidase/alpha-galactosidase [Planctomycetota bacterium]|nr:alpha-glucosidase/alpha-galactosidase [Planctomycetota bacterium]
MKIVLIGAGSQSFGRGQIADLLQAAELRGRGVTLALVDENAEALALMTSLARRIKEHTRSDITITSTTDRRAALAGARYVITAVARKRYPLWEQDFRVPLAHGFKHVLGENGGPGALFHALRSLHLVIPICRDVEQCCPDALLLNFTNPEARVLHAILHLTKVKAAGICHGVFDAERWICRYLAMEREKLEIVSAGMNHFYCILRVTDLTTGGDRLAELLQKVREDTSPQTPPLFKKLAEIFDVFTFPSDDHIGEYLSFGAEFHGTKWPYGQESRPVRLQQQERASPVVECAEGRAPVTEEILRASGEVTVPIVCDIELNRGARRSAVNVLNTGGYVENLPRDAAVEVPAVVDAGGIHPLTVGPVPETFAAYMRTQFAIHSLVTEAFRTRSRKRLLQALLLDPCVNSIVGAEGMLGEILELQKDFLPAFE